jgi:hypothetical protein
MKMGGMGYKESSGLTPWASRARRERVVVRNAIAAEWNAIASA